MDNLLNVDLYTDGACSGNPGMGGWAYILLCIGKKKECSGFCLDTTNNKMELQAVIEGIKALKKPCNLTIYSDSAYVCDAFNGKWIDNWLVNGFKNSKNQPVSNKELWLELLELLKKYNYKFIKVKGHADNEFNNMCDKMATGEIKKFKEKLATLNLNDSDTTINNSTDKN